MIGYRMFSKSERMTTNSQMIPASRRYIDVPEGQVHWFTPWKPGADGGPCDHDCVHPAVMIIAWGPDFEHYELGKCQKCSCIAWYTQAENPFDEPSQSVAGFHEHISEDCATTRS